MNPEDAGGKIAVRLSEIAKAGGLRRVMEVGAIDKEARTVELSFSSEVEYERWFGMEILSHDPAHVDLARLSNKAPVLWMHDWRDQRGVVESVQIVERKGRAVLRFSKSPAGDQLFQDIIDGIITKVSVGYRVRGMQLLEMREDIDVFLVDAWEPFEISMVSVPADDTVGVGRSSEHPAREEPPANVADTSAVPEQRANSQPPRKEVIRMDEDDVTPGTKPPVVDAKAIVQAERQRQADMTRMGKEAGAEELAQQFIADGKSTDELRAALFDKFVKERSAKPMAEQERGAEIGMSDKDVKRYSLMKVVRALANPGDKRAQKEAAFEIECSIAAQDQYGKEARGILVPHDVLSRAFNAGGAPNTPTGAQTGQGLVQTNLLTGSFIDMLRNRTTILRMATIMGGLVGNVDIPRQTGGATGYWIGEGDDAPEGTPVIGQIGMSPKTVAAYTDITRRLMLQSTPDAEGIVRRDLFNAIGQTIDRAGYYGSGTNNEPRGIKNYTGLNAVDFAAVNPTFPELVAMETAIAADNADVNSMGYVANAKFRGYAKSTVKFASAGSATIWEPGNTVNGYRAEITNQTDDGDVFFGNFADLIVGMWGGLDLTVDTATLSKSGGTRLVVFQDLDFVLRRVESLCYGSATVA